MRGILDGDGHVHRVKSSVHIEISTGSQKFFNQIRAFLDSNYIKNTGSFKDGFGILRICTQREVYKFYIKAYADKGPCFTRKQIKIEQAPSIKKFIEENAANSGKP